MHFRVGIENNNDGIRSVAWMLEHPGCYAYGNHQQEALVNAGAAIRTYTAWINAHGESWLTPDEGIEINVDEIWMDFNINKAFVRVERGGYTVEPFFLHDWKPLTAEEIERGLKLLAWSRADLLQAVAGLSAEQLSEKKEGERWPIAGILNHIGSAEWWYLDRLGLAFSRHAVPKEPFERLEKVRALMNDALPKLVESNQVVGAEGEFWSPRKVLRRAVWHECDHVEHIRKLV